MIFLNSNSNVLSFIGPILLLEKMAFLSSNTSVRNINTDNNNVTNTDININTSLNQTITLSKSLDIILNQKLMPILCESLTPFCYDILVLSSKRDHLNLKVWITNTFKTKKEPFVLGLSQYLLSKSHNMAPLTPEIIKNIISTIETLKLKILRYLEY